MISLLVEKKMSQLSNDPNVMHDNEEKQYNIIRDPKEIKALLPLLQKLEWLQYVHQPFGQHGYNITIQETNKDIEKLNIKFDIEQYGSINQKIIIQLPEYKKTIDNKIFLLELKASNNEDFDNYYMQDNYQNYFLNSMNYTVVSKDSNIQLQITESDQNKISYYLLYVNKKYIPFQCNYHLIFMSDVILKKTHKSLLDDNEVLKKAYENSLKEKMNLKNFQIQNKTLVSDIEDNLNKYIVIGPNIDCRIFQLLAEHEILNIKDLKYINDRYYVMIKNQKYYLHAMFFSFFKDYDNNIILNIIDDCAFTYKGRDDSIQYEQTSKDYMIINENQKKIIAKGNIKRYYEAYYAIKHLSKSYHIQYNDIEEWQMCDSPEKEHNKAKAPQEAQLSDQQRQQIQDQKKQQKQNSQVLKPETEEEQKQQDQQQQQSKQKAAEVDNNNNQEQPELQKQEKPKQQKQNQQEEEQKQQIQNQQEEEQKQQIQNQQEEEQKQQKQNQQEEEQKQQIQNQQEEEQKQQKQNQQEEEQKQQIQNQQEEEQKQQIQNQQEEEQKQQIQNQQEEEQKQQIQNQQEEEQKQQIQNQQEEEQKQQIQNQQAIIDQSQDNENNKEAKEATQINQQLKQQDQQQTKQQSQQQTSLYIKNH